MHIFAHAQELHTETTSDFEHFITNGFTAAPLFLAAVILVVIILKNVAHAQLHHIALALLAIFFFTGIMSYTLVPAISIISLTLGIGLALFLSLAAISKG